MTCPAADGRFGDIRVHGARSPGPPTLLGEGALHLHPSCMFIAERPPPRHLLGRRWALPLAMAAQHDGAATLLRADAHAGHTDLPCRMEPPPACSIMPMLYVPRRRRTCTRSAWCCGRCAPGRCRTLASPECRCDNIAPPTGASPCHRTSLVHGVVSAAPRTDGLGACHQWLQNALQLCRL